MERKEHVEEDILNDALELAMAWGKYWLQPIQDRLSEKYPALSQEDLDHYNKIAQDCMKFGHDTVHSMAGNHGKHTSFKDFSNIFSTKFPWASKRNIQRCFNQGMYYAWKDLGFR